MAFCGPLLYTINASAFPLPEGYILVYWTTCKSPSSSLPRRTLLGPRICEGRPGPRPESGCTPRA
eukprot:scaffold9175_cov57-Phaeocystis_antarctica.AAC.4